MRPGSREKVHAGPCGCPRGSGRVRVVEFSLKQVRPQRRLLLDAGVACSADERGDIRQRVVNNAARLPGHRGLSRDAHQHPRVHPLQLGTCDASNSIFARPRPETSRLAAKSEITIGHQLPSETVVTTDITTDTTKKF